MDGIFTGLFPATENQQDGPMLQARFSFLRGAWKRIFLPQPDYQIMSLEKRLQERASAACELCQAVGKQNYYALPPSQERVDENMVVLCDTCLEQVEKKAEPNDAHWQQALPTAIWSEYTPVKILAWRLLSRFKHESWAAELRDMIYLEEQDLVRAQASGDHEGGDALHRDSNGAMLKDGDAVVLTRSLDVKGSTLNAKMGTVVKNIRLVADNTEQIEGKIEGQTIVILTKYLRKQGN